mmetsp:Transcript_14290/g.53822  ORF Transcript_14290/g.53822 Transcript_14290/m.53822 type:complete len:221 (+) Transcript_14290:2526-3188(+)
MREAQVKVLHPLLPFAKHSRTEDGGGPRAIQQIEEAVLGIEDDVQLAQAQLVLRHRSGYANELVLHGCHELVKSGPRSCRRKALEQGRPDDVVGEDRGEGRARDGKVLFVPGSVGGCEGENEKQVVAPHVAVAECLDQDGQGRVPLHRASRRSLDGTASAAFVKKLRHHGNRPRRLARFAKRLQDVVKLALHEPAAAELEEDARLAPSYEERNLHQVVDI